MRATQLIVNLNNIKHNIIEIKKYLGNEINIMPIVKSYGYGSHLNECPEILNEFKYVGVAYLDEAIQLRMNGYENEILILYPLTMEEFEMSKKYNFILNGSNIFELINDDSKIKIHTEIETGMGRTGLQINKLDDYIKKLKKNSNIILDGLFTHLSTNLDYDFSIKQINLFEQALNEFNKSNFFPEHIHIGSSGGIQFYKNNLHNMVRIGLLIYGYYPNDSLKNTLKLEPSMLLKTNISYIKTIGENETVGYNKNFIASKKTVIATIPFGFGDGLLTLETGKPYVIINDTKAKIIGICMDNMMIDVTEVPNVKLGQEVYIWDNKELTIEELGEWCNGICNYEVISSISERVPRVLKRRGNI